MFLRCSTAATTLIAATLLPSAPVSASDTTPVPTAVTTLTAPTAMAAANGRLFVSDGNSVAVLGTDGVTVKTLTGMFGAAGIAVSATGDRVYVALSQAGAIAVIDTSSLTEVGRWTTGICPVHLAFAGTRLFYGTGCERNHKGAIASVDATTGGDPQTVAGNYYTAPLLAGAGNTLAAGETGLSPASVYTFRVDGSALTPLANTKAGSNLGGIAVNRDGTKVATASGSPYHLAQYDAATLSPAGTFDTGPYPRTVAYSHDGTRLGGGISAHGDGNVRAFDVSTGGSILSGDAHPKSAYNQPDPIAGTLTWSLDDRRLYTLLDESDNGKHTYWLATGFEQVTAPATTTTKLKVTAPAKYGAKVRASATVSGLAGVPVRFVRTGPGASATATATTNGSGTATATLNSSAGGTITAYYDGDATHAASSASATYKAPTRSRIKLTGQYKTVKKVAHFHKISDVHAEISVTAPAPDRKVTVRLQRKSGSKWQTVQTVPATMPDSGVDNYTLIKAQKNVQFRFTVRFGGDTYGKASSANSGAVIIK